MLQSDLCNYSDAYIVIKGTITVIKANNRDRNNRDRNNRSLSFKNNSPFISCISKINNVLIDSAEDLDVAMSIIERQQVVYGIITEINLIIIMLIIIMQIL